MHVLHESGGHWRIVCHPSVRVTCLAAAEMKFDVMPLGGGAADLGEGFAHGGGSLEAAVLSSAAGPLPCQPGWHF